MTADERLQLLTNDMAYLREAADSLELNAIAFYQETNQHEMVKAFHKKFGVNIPSTPDLCNRQVALYISLIDEEFNELLVAQDAGDLPGFVDAVCDLLYVVHGIALAAGIQHIQPFFEEVHATNMAKVGGKRRADGKIEKPEGWQPPRIAELLAERYPDSFKSLLSLGQLG